METNQRMSKRLAWLFGVVVLVSIGLLVDCGSKYNPASDGLVLVSSQGSGLLETFSFSLNNGSIFAVNNPPADTSNQTCVLKGIPSSIVVDPAGAYAYTILFGTDICGQQGQAVIATFKVNSDGTLTAVGTPVADPNPITLVMDSTGKYLFAAEGLSTLAITNAAQYSTPCVQSATQNGVCVYAIGSGGSLTVVPGTFTFALPVGFQPPNFAAVAVTPMVFPAPINGVQQAVCSGMSAPTLEFLYAADAANNVLWEFSVNPSTGALGNPPNASQVPSFPSASSPATTSVPSGVAVDACDRFVYVGNNVSNNISAYTICNAVTPTCQADGSLTAVAGSPFSLAGSDNGPGPMLVDPFGNYLYVLETLSNQVSTFRISPVSGSLTAGSPATVSTGSQPKSMAIRSDDSWLFVANFNAATISQYSVTPDTGALTKLPTDTTTDNYPWGVAVK
jgi:6-phosphogluconolactonase (cycloisomerase 2 family)